MIVRFFMAALWLTGGTAMAEDPAPAASPFTSPRLAPFKERLATAESVKVQTEILGVKLDSTLAEAHLRLDPLGDPARPAVEAAEEAEHDDERKVMWELGKSDFRSVLVKTDQKGRIVYIAGFLRKGKEIPFEKIGETARAPILSDYAVAWDVVRPGQPLLRVAARGEKARANSITIFVVKRPPHS